MERVWQKSYPKKVPHDIDPNSFSSVVDVFEKSCEKFGKLPSFTNMGQTLTFADLDRLTYQFASYLRNVVGLKKGDRIAIQMPNLLQLPIAIFGALRAGLVVVNTNPLYTPREMEHQFKDSGAKAIVILANFACQLEKVIKNTSIENVIVTEIGDLLGFPKGLLINAVVKHVKKMVPNYNLPNAVSFNEALTKGKNKPFPKESVTADDIAFLQYTGGTTGVSKGAMLTHRNIVSNMEQISAWMSPLLKEGEERVVTALPLYHIFALTVNCLSFFKIGGCNILITNPKDIPAFVKILNTNKFTIMTGVNTLYNALMNHKDFPKIDFSKCKISVAGGMALQQAVTKRWVQKVGSPLVEGYGLTEASPVVCCNPIDGSDQVGTIGMPVPSTDIRIVGEDGKDVADGEPGELWTKGPQVMKGYWNRPDETAKVITSDGWLKTGDMAAVQPDGFFKIVDRKKDMILVSGFNVYPNEIEDVVAMNPKVLEVAAIGVPDDKSGEVVKVFIVKKDTTLTSEEIIHHCRENLVAYKVPRAVEFRNELPKSNIGKILRRELRPN
ncbi:MAG: AMP-binding protein [Bdellovibrionales bacterium]|nr:AMP-binding protein [Bdellovibrionales bacterium]